jgi:glycosyltransferase involved in cell wall biosynthesis
VARQLQLADVGMVPYEESNGTHCAFVAKAVESLGCGLPVVSTPLENLRRYFGGEPAIRFSGFDGASFADAVIGTLRKTRAERRELGRLASGRVARELDWSCVTGAAVDFVEARFPGTRNGLGSPSRT